MSVPGGGTSGSSTEWWEKVELGDIAGCTKAVKEFINETGTIDEAQVLKALPLFVLCCGDLVWLANGITDRTDTVCNKAKAISKYEDAIVCPQEWKRRLTSLGGAFSRLPDSFKGDPTNPAAHRYKDLDVAKVYDAVQSGIADSNIAILRRKPALKVDLRGAPPRNP